VKKGVQAMSALGQKQTCAVHKGMSALPPKADMCGATAYVCFGPKADIDNQVDQLVSAWKNMKQLEIRGRQLSRTATKLSTAWAYGPTSNICRMQIG
jgi:hypothetical protein